MKTSSRQLKNFRVSCGLTIRNLAGMIRSNYRFISNVENGRSLPSAALIEKLALNFQDFNVSAILSLIVRDKGIMDSITLLRHFFARSECLSEERYNEIRQHLALTPRGLLCCVSRCSELFAFSDNNSTIIVPNPNPEMIAARTIIVSTEDPVDGQQSLVVSCARTGLVIYNKDYHGAFPAFPVVGTLPETVAHYVDKALPRSRKRGKVRSEA